MFLTEKQHYLFGALSERRTLIAPQAPVYAA
jgi:hypothetical protein